MSATKAASARRSRRPRSIRTTVTLLFAATLVLALALITSYESLVSSYYRGESNPVTRFLKPAPAVARTARTSMLVMRRVNAAILAGPDEAAKQSFLEEAAALASPLGIALRIGDRITFASPPLEARRAAALPAFGSASPYEPFAEDPEERSPGVLFQMDFRTGGGGEATFFLLHGPSAERRKPPFTRQMALIVALILLAADGAAGVFFILRVTGPLRRVESAALAMSRGDLETPVEGGYRFVELERAFEALETMRSEIRELLEREREGEAERRELIANLSHDLRTPLAAIRGYVDGLREGIADTPEKRQRYLGVLGEKIHVLDRMIGQIFLLSTLEAQEAPPEPRLVDLRAFLSDSIEELRLSTPADAASFEEAGLEGPPRYARADPLQLRRVVENLVDNALRHGGRKPIRIRIGLCEAPGALELFVEDDGRGIAPEDLEIVFERFWRGDKARSEGGFGLGLAIARRIAQAHGGSIRAERAGGGAGGARIVVSLPEARPPEGGAP